MVAIAVTFDGVRFHTADSYTNWGNYGGSGAGGSNEAPLAYQNSLASNRKQAVTGGTLGGIDYDPAAGALDHNASNRRLVFIKAYVSDAFDLNTSEGLRITVGSAAADTRKYNFAGSTATNDAHLAYPQQGGYILAAIDVTVTFWPITTTGAIDDTIIDYYGIQGSWITGTAKAENIAMDSIDVGTGLYLVGDTANVGFGTYVEKDQDIKTNRWGCCSGAGNNVATWCILRAGGGIQFNDVDSVVAFRDGYHGAGLTGVLHELDTAGATFTMGALLIGEGKLYNAGAIDTRPDYTVTGTTMIADYNLTGTLRNFRNVVLNSKVIADGADIECQLLTQATAEIKNSVIRTNALTSVACIVDPTFGVTSGLHDTTFVQSGAGHAIEIGSAGAYTFTNLSFTGYGADTTDDAALDITATSGTVTITLVGASPTFKTAGATVVFNNDISVTFDKMKDGTEIRVFEAGTQTEILGSEDHLDTGDGAQGGTTDDRSWSWSAPAATSVDYQLINKNYVIIRVEGFSVPSVATTIDFQQRIDLNV